jgi:predicted DNA-binding transcriptional regulator AlpA
MHARHKQPAPAAPSPPRQKIRSGYLNEAELADELGVSRRTVWRWRCDGEGPPVTMLGRVPLFRIEAVEQWLLTRERKMPRERTKTNEHNSTPA